MYSKLSSSVNPTLCDQMVKEQLDDLPFKEWLKWMKILDNAQLKHITDVAKEAACLLHHNDSHMLMSSSSQCTTNHPATGSTASTTADTTTKPIPKLMDVKCQLLHNHESCFKCHWFYISHCGNDCPNRFPNPAKCRTLTEQQACTVAKSSPAIVAPVTTKPVVIASVLLLSKDPSKADHKLYSWVWVICPWVFYVSKSIPGLSGFSGTRYPIPAGFHAQSGTARHSQAQSETDLSVF